MKKYWKAGRNHDEVRRNEGHDGEGRPPGKKLRQEWPDGGVIAVWYPTNEDAEPSEVIEW